MYDEVQDGSGYQFASIYDPRTGEILKTYYGPSSCFQEAMSCENYPYVPGSFDSASYYIKTPTPGENTRPIPTQRPAQGIKLNKKTIMLNDTVKITDIPRNAEVHIAGRTHVVADGVLEWSTPLPGVYAIAVESFPFLPWEGFVKVLDMEGGFELNEG